MFRSYEEAQHHIEVSGNSNKPGACYIMTKDSNYYIAYGVEEKEYAESLGYVIATS